MPDRTAPPVANALPTDPSPLAPLKLADEERVVGDLLKSLGLSEPDRAAIKANAERFVASARARKHEQSPLDAFLHTYGLSTEEGVALMCLAEALLRVPDADTADALISEKIAAGHWADHLGESDSTFVNASTWALMLTGQVVDLGSEVAGDVAGWLGRLVKRMGEPAIRAAMMQAMRILGGQFVLGSTIKEALSRGAKLQRGRLLYSFDMLGEGARTAADAARYFESYSAAIDAIGKAAKGSGPTVGPGVSVKLSALHPRYDLAHRTAVLTELGGRLTMLARQAKSYGIGFTLDAEEADRLELSLELLDMLARNPDLAGWDGLGLAVQAYQKRAVALIDRLAVLARATGRRLMVRLVKGAYWDTEIKRAQELGLADYSVFTRKAATDLSYLAAAERLFAAGPALFPQFATHNAFTIAAILHLGRDVAAGSYEFQRLHGMGELLYDVVSSETRPAEAVPCRVYAPVGPHEDLLPYLVRRLLENGANSSFLNRFLDSESPISEIVADPVAILSRAPAKRHPGIPTPPNLYGAGRRNAAGLDLGDSTVVDALRHDLARAASRTWHAAPLVAGAERAGDGHPVVSPTDHDVRVGTVVAANADDVGHAFAASIGAQPAWDARGGDRRAAILRRMGDALEGNRTNLMSLAIREAGKTIPDALSEVREATDFCRYYAAEAERLFAKPSPLPGPVGESNNLALHGRGTLVCISPWNFPLAIFTGQVAAALAAGNAVIAKPAPQTPLIAAEAVRLFHEAGVPPDVLHLLPGGSDVGQVLISDPRLGGVAFTGSTATARAINRTLAARDGPIVPLIAETGGQNAMIVDSTALLEQAADDIVKSAFISAGQRCSALRVLYAQTEIADRLLDILSGAMDALVIGDPAEFATDIGPIIDPAARQKLSDYAAMRTRKNRLVKQCRLGASASRGTFFPPTIFEIPSIRDIEGEVFGPILHVIRYHATALDGVLADIRDTGFGLTLGIESRIEARVRQIIAGSRVGNIYVNRGMTGAVVGVQPFGGEGLSGTGPKAGGPHYLPRFATERTVTINIAAAGGNAALFSLEP